MDFITLKGDHVVIPDKYLDINFLRHNEVNIPFLSNKINGYTLTISLSKSPTKSIYDKIIKKYPEVLDLINKSCLCYGEYNLSNPELMLSIVWIYEYYYNYNCVLFLPIGKSIIDSFNESIIQDSTYYLSNVISTDLESLEQFEYTNKTIPFVSVFGFSDSLFHKLGILNKRRLQTQLKKIIKKSTYNYIFSTTNISDLECLDSIIRHQLVTKPINNFEKILNNCSLIDLLDSDDETYSLNQEMFIDTIKSLENKRIYISLNVSIQKLKRIETALINAGISVSRKDNPESNVVINSVKTSKDTILINNYDVFFLIFEKITDPIDILDYLCHCVVNRDCEVYFDSSRIKNIEKIINKLTSDKIIQRNIIKDSHEYTTYESCITDKDHECVIISDYYTFESSNAIQKMNLSNLTKNDYDTIRNFVKFNLSKLDIETRTCQLTTPSSPKDRRIKLNSLSNKVSSVNYRCDVTCEIFKDYTIGVIVWNDCFRGKKVVIEKNKVYVYQTTNGNWKYTTVC